MTLFEIKELGRRLFKEVRYVILGNFPLFCSNTEKKVNDEERIGYMLPCKQLARSRSLRLVLFMLLCVVVFTFLVASHRRGEHFVLSRVAHAGGGINGDTYTNSYEALNSNFDKGFRYFEIDLSFTSDGQLVCIHDWKSNARRLFGFEPSEPPTLEGFKKLVMKHAKYHLCTLYGLAQWMKSHPTAVIVTDVKDYRRNLEALRIIKKVLPSAEVRVIPQIYKPENYFRVKRMGYKRIIWTLYRFGGSEGSILSWISKFKGPFAITMPKQKADAGLLVELVKRKVPVYVHTINNASDAQRFLGKGKVEIYTDFLAPGRRE